MSKANSGRSGKRAGRSGKTAVLILAAGKGTRLKSNLAKVLHQVAGRPLVEHVVAAATQAVRPRDIYVVVGHQAQRVREAIKPLGVRFVEQREQRGTGHAVMVARRALAGYKQVLVLSGDVPLMRAETIRGLRDFHLAQQAAMTVLTATPSDPRGYGRVLRRSRHSNEVAGIVEEKALTAEQAAMEEINSGIYAFATRPLFQHLPRLGTDNAHREFYLTDMARLLADAGERVAAERCPDASEVLGANTLAELAELDARARQAKARELMAAGVTIYRPETSTIDAGVRVGADTVLEPFVQLRGKTSIGSECRIGSYTVIEDCAIGNGVVIRTGSVLEQSQVAKGAVLGPYAHVRPGSVVGEGAHVGNFVELKKTRLGKGSKANHLAYLGDARIGAGVNVGAGTITCNYDGAQKHVTVIEDGAFIGSDAILVAPLRIGRRAYVAAGSTITENVPAESLALGRARQTNKRGWASRRKQAGGSKTGKKAKK